MHVQGYGASGRGVSNYSFEPLTHISCRCEVPTPSALEGQQTIGQPAGPHMYVYASIYPYIYLSLSLSLYIYIYIYIYTYLCEIISKPRILKHHIPELPTQNAPPAAPRRRPSLINSCLCNNNNSNNNNNNNNNNYIYIYIYIYLSQPRAVAPRPSPSPPAPFGSLTA